MNKPDISVVIVSDYDGGSAKSWKDLRCTVTALASLPLTALVVTCHAAGEFVGYLLGPGNSPRQLA